MTPEREEALRLARTGDRSQMTRGDMSLLIDALAADLEDAERKHAEQVERNRELHKLGAQQRASMEARAEAAERERDEWKQGAFKFDEERRAAERERDEAQSEVERLLPYEAEAVQLSTDLATAREALERELRFTHGEETKDRIRAALRSLGDVD